MESSTVGILLSKLKDPHPTVQRYAVRSIFQAMKEQIHNKSAHAFEQTLSHCMLQASRSPPALDEAQLQLCALVVDSDADADADAVLSSLVLTHLQAALEAAPSEAVPSLVRTIGFVCRHLLSTHSHILGRFQTYELHPFVKAFRSRQESLFEIMQQVLALITQERFLKNLEVSWFLQPFFHYVLLQYPAHDANLVAARDLFFGLASLAHLNFELGTVLIRLLIHYVSHLISHTKQEADWKFVASRELVDSFQNLVMQASLESEVEQCSMIALDIQTYLVDSCYESKKQGLSFQTFLELLNRTVKLQKSFETTLLWRTKLLSLAPLLTMTAIKEEQMILIDLARNVLRKKDIEGMDILIDSSLAFPLSLLWVYPVANVMATSCTKLKDAGQGLLQDLEDLLAGYWSQDLKDPDVQKPDVCLIASYGQFADNMQTLICMLWHNMASWRTWNSIQQLEDMFICKNTDVQSWLRKLSTYNKEKLESVSNMADPWSSKYFEDSDLTSWVCMIMSVALVHPAWDSSVRKAVAEIVKTEPSVGLSMVPVALFYLRSWKRHLKGNANQHLFRMLNLLPVLGLHPMASSIVTGVVQALLHSDGCLPGTGIRLLCRTWENADKIYPQLQVHLELSHFVGPITDYETLLGRAASLKDVCKRDADRGVDLILSIQACIENGSVIVKAFGLECLAWLCQHDVIDFYTAWDVISVWFLDLTTNTTLAKSLCLCLQNGALDAAVYPDLSGTILQLLWKAAKPPESSEKKKFLSDWWTVQEKALIALASFEVDHLTQFSGRLAGNHVEILFSETRTEVLRACERLVVKFLCHEFKNRPRGQENAKYIENKLGKIITAIPRVFSSSVQRERSLPHSPAAFLLRRYDRVLSLSTDSQAMGKHKLKTWESEFEQQFTETADITDSHENLICSLLHFDIWHSFLTEQLKEGDGGTLTIGNVARQVVKILCTISREAIPRVAKNAILALAVLYKITASHAVILDDLHKHVVSYLKSCISQSSHEYLQWTSAAALGYIAQYSNKADWGFKMDIATSLLECLSQSERDIVRGACGMALGFVFLNLFTADDDMFVSEVLKDGMVQQKESSIHSHLFQQLIKLLLIWCPEMAGLLQNISKHNTKSVISSMELPLSVAHIKPLAKSEGRIWTVAGLSMALGSSALAFERIGSLDLLMDVTKFLIKGIHISEAKPDSRECFNGFSLGAYISLPLCIRACLRLEHLPEDVGDLIPVAEGFLTNEKNLKIFPAELTMAVCIGSGNLLATVLNQRTYKVPKNHVFPLIDSLKAIALNDDAELASIGGFIGLANALGAGVALLVPHKDHGVDELKSLPPTYGETESSSVCTPLLYESSCKEYVQNLLQALLNSALHGSNHIRSTAWWSLALITRTFMKADRPGLDVNAKSSKLRLSSLAKDSSLFLLCSWLLKIEGNLVESSFPCHTVASVLRCLKEAPQLPYLDWGTLLRRIMHKFTPSRELEVAQPHKNIAAQDDVCRECILFTLAHAHSFSVLQALLDELCDFPRLFFMRTSMSSVLMLHMNELSTLFSKPRMERFFIDCVELMCRSNNSLGSDSLFSVNDCWDLRISFWKGFKALLLVGSKDGTIPSIDRDKLFLVAEKCLCLLESPLCKTENQSQSIEEWSAVLDCVTLASDEWIAKMTEPNLEGLSTTVQTTTSADKAIFLKSQLVARGRLHPSALLNAVKWCLHNQAVPDTFQQLLWIACALKNIAIEEKQSWLMDAIENVFSLKSTEMGVLFLALLVSSWCCYSPLILIDKKTTIKVLPFTFQSLLSEPKWRSTSRKVLQRCVQLLSNVGNPSLTERGSPLWYVKRACAMLRKDLPFEEQLKLVDGFFTGPVS